MGGSVVDERIDEVRRFNRFFTRRIGVLGEGLLRSPFSLAEARILFEVSRGDGPTAADLARDLGLDPGYLSRLLARLGRQGLVDKVPSEEDGRRFSLRLTAAGEEAASTLERRSREEVAGMLGELSEEDQRRLLDAARTIEGVLDDGDPRSSGPFVLRPHEPGDIGWVVQRHGELYAREYGWDATFEALVARIAADFVDGYDPSRERCWIAEMGGERVGCVFVVKESEEVAKLRMLLVDPGARGLGLGSRLVGECVRFARNRGYEKLALWTNSVLLPARRIYETHGFRLVVEEQHRSFGKDLVGESWELEL